MNLKRRWSCSRLLYCDRRFWILQLWSLFTKWNNGIPECWQREAVWYKKNV